MCSLNSVTDVTLSRTQPILVPSYQYFLILANDIPQVKKDKMRLLRKLVTADNYQSLLREFIVSTSMLVLEIL